MTPAHRDANYIPPAPTGGGRTLPFPNVLLGLPGMPYDGPEPDGFAGHSDVVEWLERYVALINAPVRERTAVGAGQRVDGHWEVETTQGRIRASAMVVATGPFQRPRIPL